MNIETNLENAKLAYEMAKQKAENLKKAADKENSEAEQADIDAKKLSENATKQSNIYTESNTKVTSKQKELDNAMNKLNSLNEEDTDAIEQVKQEIEQIKKELEAIKEEANKEYEILLKLQQDAQTAIKRAEIEKQEAETSLQELEKAEEELVKAEQALKEAEELAAEELKLEKEVDQLTEEEALKEGYTVIKTAEDLQAVSQNLSGKYILMNDIDLSGVEWEPIGNVDPTAEDPWAGAFKGIFNGNGYTIKNLTVTADENDGAVGLFGATDSATITDVIIRNANVSAGTEFNEIAVGGLIGISRDTNIDNVTVTGNMTGHQGVGGLIGVIDDTQEYGKNEITNVNTFVNVNSSFYAGGLIGKINNTSQNSLMLENCHTSGSVTVSDSCAGGLIGEAGKTIITVNNCSSNSDITRVSDLPSDLSWLLDTSKIGGIIGNCNGTYISICNSEFNGTLNSDDEFKGEYYGWYMNDAQVSIFEVSAGLPVNDILNIEGVESITPIIDPQTGEAHYEITVSTLAGMNRIVDMIQANPSLADFITYNIQFDFETMDEAYDSTIYSQYGVVQHLYEDENGEVVNDVYIDNEIDLESTFNTQPYEQQADSDPTVCLKETMIKGLFRDPEGKYYISTGETGGKYEGYTEVSLEFFFKNKANVRTRLSKEEVEIREGLTQVAYKYQSHLQNLLAEKYGIKTEDIYKYLIKEPEYKSLKKKEALGETLTQEEQLKIELYELNYKIANIVGEITNNKGCGMGGDASFLDSTTTVVLEDEDGRVRYMTISGLELRQKLDENGELLFDKNGEPVFETLDGEEYDGTEGKPYTVRGVPVTNEEGQLLYTDKEGKTVIKIKKEDGSCEYVYEDGTKYEGDEEDLEQQLTEQTVKSMFDDLEAELEELKKSYTGEETPVEETEEEKKQKDEEDK